MSRFDGLAFGGEWRRYQRAALAAFEQGRAAGARRTHIVAPPGSGKTLLGVEMIRRAGARALVLAPSLAISQQWPRAVAEFTRDRREAAELAGADPAKPIACLSYQALCELDDPEILLGRLARTRWALERASATGTTPEQAAREGEALAGHEAERRARELAAISAALKDEVARGDHAGVELRDLLSATARERVGTLSALGVGLVVLDECHHLASLWGYVVRAVLQELPEDVHVVGLTATPPASLGGEDLELYEALLGPVGFTVPTPAVVRDGHLAPYQDLAWLTEPAPIERAWLAEHDERVREAVAPLLDDLAEARPGDDEPLARARTRLRFARGAAARDEAERVPPSFADWEALLEHAGDRALAALRELRRGAHADRLLTNSQAKALGLVDVLAAERAARGDGLRGLVLCDAELAPPRPDDVLTGILEPAAGTGRHSLLALAADSRTAGLRPLLVSGRGLRCAPADADALLEALREAAEDRFALPEWEAEVDGLLVALESSGAEWMPRAWVELATRLLVAGTTRVLVGTRGQLGEGWECAPLNVLVDLTVSASGPSVPQMRGRSLRPDPGDPGKVASNWDVVCAAPGLVRGAADYERFASRHRHAFAPAEDGELEAGPSHVHPDVGPFAPPPAERFAALNREQVARAADRDGARERWAVGTAYRGVELPTLLVRRPDGEATRSGRAARPPAISQRAPLAAGLGGAVLFAVLAVVAGAPALLAGLLLAPAGLAVAAVRLGRARRRLPRELSLDGAARAVAEAYRSLGELSQAAAASLAITPRAAGYLRCRLTAASPDDGRAFAAALAELVGVSAPATRLVSRPVPDPADGALALLGRVLRRRPPFPESVHPVPADLAREDRRAEAFHAAWRRHVGPGRLSERAEAAAEDGGYETLVREVWV